MKLRETILVMIALAIGVAASVMTSRFVAKSVAPEPIEMVEVIVANRDLPVGTVLQKDHVRWQSMAKKDVPQVYVMSVEEIENKRLGRAVRSGETLNPMDLKVGSFVTLPPNMDMVTLVVGVNPATADFLIPGSRVDVIGVLPTNERPKVFPLLRQSLVLAIDGNLPIEPQHEYLAPVSFAMSRKQVELVQLARKRNVKFSLVMCGSDKPANDDDPFQDELIQFLQSLPETPSLSRDAESPERSVGVGNASIGSSAPPQAAKP